MIVGSVKSRQMRCSQFGARTSRTDHTLNLDGCNGRMYGGKNRGDLLFFLRRQRQQRKAREATTVPAQVHDVFYAGDATFRDDAPRGLSQLQLQFPGTV